MSYSYPIQQIQPRSYILTSNSDALSIQSINEDTKLTFYNSKTLNYNGEPKYVFSMSNESFKFIKNSTVISQTDLNTISDTEKQANQTLYGSLNTSNINILKGYTQRKGITVNDNNTTSVNQFSGLGYSNSSLIHQVENTNSRFSFFAGKTVSSSTEWMRIQEGPLGNVQVGIGTTLFDNNTSLKVSGNTIIDGSLTVANGIEGLINTTQLDTKYIRLDPLSNRISCNVMPQGVVFLNNNNKIDDSVLPTSYNFQYLKTNKNVGIGTKIALQKFHVNGSVFFTERLGIGTSNPSSRLHIKENNATIPSLIIDSSSSSDILKIISKDDPSTMIINGNFGGIGFGISNVDPNYKVQVKGDMNILGSIRCSNVIYEQEIRAKSMKLETNSRSIFRVDNIIQDPSLNLSVTGEAVSCGIPYIFNSGLSTNYITAGASNGFVVFANSSVQIDNQLSLNNGAIVYSDIRLKKNIKQIDQPMNRLNYIHGYTYDYNNSRCAGVIAQEVVDGLPEAVGQLKGDYIGVKYDSLIPLLIECIHDLKKRIEILEQKL